MSQRAEPHAHDFCAKHAQQFTAPVGWQFLQLTEDITDEDDLLAVANAVNTPDDLVEPADASSGSVTQVDRSVAPARPTPLADKPSPLRLVRPE